VSHPCNKTPLQRGARGRWLLDYPLRKAQLELRLRPKASKKRYGRRTSGESVFRRPFKPRWVNWKEQRTLKRGAGKWLPVTRTEAMEWPHDSVEVAAQLGLNPQRRDARNVWIDCPSCGKPASRKKASVCFKPGKNGVWHCFSCVESGHLGSLWRAHAGDTAPPPVPRFQRSYSPSRGRSRTVDVVRGFAELRVDDCRPARTWALERGWPVELADLVAKSADVAWAWQGSVKGRHGDKLAAQGKEVDRRLLIAYRDAAGAVRTVGRRWHGAGSPTDGKGKSIVLAGNVSAYSGVKVIGDIPRAALRLVGGGTVHLCEGDPDALALSAWCLHDELNATVLGAGAGHGNLPKIARALARELRDNHGVETVPGRVMLWPHPGDKADVGAESMAFAGRILARACTVLRADVPVDADGKGDASGILERGDDDNGRDGVVSLYRERLWRRLEALRDSTTNPERLDHAGIDGKDLTRDMERGGLDGLRAVARAASRVGAPVSLKAARADLEVWCPAALRTRGVHVCRAGTGTGKTYIGVRAVAALALETVRFKAARKSGQAPTNRWLDCVAGKGGPVVLQWQSPTRELRDATARDFRKVLARHGLDGAKVIVRVRRGSGETDDNWCPAGELRALAGRAGGKDLTREVCKACPLYGGSPRRASCGRWKEWCKSVSADVVVEFTTHALAALTRQPEGSGDDGELPPDIVWIDESPAGTWIPTMTVTLEQMTVARACGDLIMDDPTWANLTSALAGRGHLRGGAALAAFGHIEGGDGAATTAHYLNQARGPSGNLPAFGTAAYRTGVTALEKAPNPKVWREQARAIADDGAVYLRRTNAEDPTRAVHVSTKLQTPTGAYSTVYVDATVTEGIAAALLPGSSWKEVACTMPLSSRFLRVSGAMGKRDVARALDGDKARARAGRRWLETHRHLDKLSGDTLHVTHKGDLTDKLSAHCAGSVIYHAGASSTGSNAYENCKRVVIDDWHVPGDATWALVQALEVTEAVAEEHLRHRRQTQSVGRGRPLNGGLDVYFCGDVPPDLAELVIDEDLDADVLAYQGDGDCIGNAASLAAGRELVKRAGGVLCPSLTDAGMVHHHPAKYSMAKPWYTVPALVTDGLKAVKAVGKRYGWLDFAIEAGLHYAELGTSAGGLTAVLSAAPLERADVADLVERHGWQWADGPDGNRAYRDGSSRTAKLDAALASVPPGAPVTTATLADAGGVDVTTVRRWLKKAPPDWLEVVRAVRTRCDRNDEVADCFHDRVAIMAAAPDVPNPTLSAALRVVTRFGLCRALAVPAVVAALRTAPPPPPPNRTDDGASAAPA
jgi:hypothetical protein